MTETRDVSDDNLFRHLVLGAGNYILRPRRPIRTCGSVAAHEHGGLQCTTPALHQPQTRPWSWCKRVGNPYLPGRRLFFWTMILPSGVELRASLLDVDCPGGPASKAAPATNYQRFQHNRIGNYDPHHGRWL